MRARALPSCTASREFLFVADVQQHATHFSLMRNVGGAELGDHREVERRGGVVPPNGRPDLRIVESDVNSLLILPEGQGVSAVDSLIFQALTPRVPDPRELVSARQAILASAGIGSPGFPLAVLWPRNWRPPPTHTPV